MLFTQLVVGIFIYYLPFYFQTVQGVNPTQSGIRNLPFLITLLFSPMLSGFLITLLGFYLPYMWLGSALTTVGSGLLFTLKVDSSLGSQVGFQFLTGLGAGMCNQIPFNVVQYYLLKEQTIQGSAVVSFCNSLGPVLGITISQAIFANLLLAKLRLLPEIDPVTVIHAGSTAVRGVVSPESLPHVLSAFDYALTRAYLLAVIAAGLAFGCSLGMPHGNIRTKRRNSIET